MSHLITSGSDRVMVQGDVAGMAFLFVRNPEWELQFDSDRPLAVQSRRKLYDMMVAEKTLVQGFHYTFPSASPTSRRPGMAIG